MITRHVIDKRARQRFFMYVIFTFASRTFGDHGLTDPPSQILKFFSTFVRSRNNVVYIVNPHTWKTRREQRKTIYLSTVRTRLRIRRVSDFWTEFITRSTEKIKNKRTHKHENGSDRFFALLGIYDIVLAGSTIAAARRRDARQQCSARSVFSQTGPD